MRTKEEALTQIPKAALYQMNNKTPQHAYENDHEGERSEEGRFSQVKKWVVDPGFAADPVPMAFNADNWCSLMLICIHLRPWASTNDTYVVDLVETNPAWKVTSIKHNKTQSVFANIFLFFGGACNTHGNVLLLGKDM